MAFLLGLRPKSFYNNRKMDEGLAKAAKVPKAKEDIAKVKDFRYKYIVIRFNICFTLGVWLNDFFLGEMRPRV